MELRDGPKAILEAVELDKCHILISRLLQDMHSLHFSILLENASQGLLPANFLLQRGHVEGLRRRVDGDRLVRCKAKSGLGYRS